MAKDNGLKVLFKDLICAYNKFEIRLGRLVSIQ